jgi:hypothetical protein
MAHRMSSEPGFQRTREAVAGVPCPCIGRDSVDRWGSAMPLIRILVDGYSLLHAWPELARVRPVTRRSPGMR